MEDAPVGGDIEAGELVTFFHLGVGGDFDRITYDDNYGGGGG